MSGSDSPSTPGYFSARGVSPADPAPRVPHYLKALLPADRGAAVLDIGCGGGNLLAALREAGYTNLEGVDIDSQAVAAARARGLRVSRIESLEGFLAAREGVFAAVVMGHVLEHLPKPEIVSTLVRVRRALEPGGRFFLMVPNAQSSTGAYWAFEDFTHSTIFTTGSVLYVLRMAGFAGIELLDPLATADASWPARVLRGLLRPIYRWNHALWNWVTGSAWHAPSPLVFSYEIKATAVNPEPSPGTQ